jgi:hypothetical protein
VALCKTGSKVLGKISIRKQSHQNSTKNNTSCSIALERYTWIGATNAISNIMDDHVYFAKLKEEKLSTQTSTQLGGKESNIREKKT